MQHKSKGPFFFQVHARIYPGGAVHNAMAEVVSTCSLERLTFGTGFKSLCFFLRGKGCCNSKCGGCSEGVLCLGRAALLLAGYAHIHACTKCWRVPEPLRHLGNGAPRFLVYF